MQYLTRHATELTEIIMVEMFLQSLTSTILWSSQLRMHALCVCVTHRKVQGMLSVCVVLEEFHGCIVMVCRNIAN